MEEPPGPAARRLRGFKRLLSNAGLVLVQMGMVWSERNARWGQFAMVRTILVLTLLLMSNSTVAFADTPSVLVNPSKEQLSLQVLPPEQFFGEASMSYAVAKKIPDILVKLFCYCGCDETDNHKYLLDCFKDLHGRDCYICQQEAMAAFQLVKDKITLGNIQKQIDLKWAQQYPFATPSQALKDYRAAKLYDVMPQSKTKLPNGGGTCCHRLQ